MTHVIPCREFARASRMRLRERLVLLNRAIANQDNSDDAHLKLCIQAGKLIHEESGLRYTQTEIPMQLTPAPWLHVIKKLVEEFPDFDGMSQTLLELVNMYLDAMAAAKTA